MPHSVPHYPYPNPDRPRAWPAKTVARADLKVVEEAALHSPQAMEERFRGFGKSVRDFGKPADD